MAQSGWLRKQGSSIKKQGVTIALLFGYLVVALMLVQQDRTIESQRVLISDLFHDSMELSQLKVKQATDAASVKHADHRR